MVYINYYFRELKMNGNVVSGIFDAPDSEVNCKFRYNIETHQFEIWDYNKPKEEILPIPFYWLNMKLEENGVLENTEYKISI